MKFQPKRMLALLLAGIMTISAVSCASETDTEETQGDTATEAVSEEDTGYKPDIDKKDYDCDFIITGVGNARSWALTGEDYEAGDAFEDSIYERSIRIKDHLGVTLMEEDAGDWIAYAGNVIRTVQAGLDAYQLVSTSTYQGIVELMTSNAMYDFAEFEAVNLDAPYWSFEYMDGLTLEDKYLLGYNDMCLADTFCMVFNKDLMETYNLKAPYEDVDNMKWTLDTMTAFVSTVYRDNGDNIWDNRDTYGITGWGWTDFIAFVQACDLRILDRDEDGVYQLAYDNNQEKLLILLDKLSDIYESEYSWFWTHGSDKAAIGSINFGSGQALVQTMNTTALVNLRGESLRFGVLPYPMYDEEQERYQNLNWNSNLMVPSSIKDPDMVGEVIELLAYYTAPVKTAYFEDLLGSKLAEAPDDARMLDIIWGSIISDAGVVYSNLGGNTIDYYLYMVPNLCRDGVGTYSSYMKAKEKAANKLLRNTFH